MSNVPSKELTVSEALHGAAALRPFASNFNERSLIVLADEIERLHKIEQAAAALVAAFDVDAIADHIAEPGYNGEWSALCDALASSGHETPVKPERKCVGCGATEGFTSPLNLCAACEGKMAREIILKQEP